MIKQKGKAFTLVELIVVITILAILGTIAFISLQGYSKSARDSTRISDVKTIKTALELFSLETGFYPKPSNGTGVTLSGSEVWTQGVVGDSVITLLQRIDEKPVDPLTATEYTYSRLNTKKEFELAAVLEDSSVVFNAHQANAEGTKQGTAHVSGTYNSVTSKVKIGSTYYLLALPSIIANDLSLTQIENIVNNNKFVYNGYKNLPANYAGTNYNLNGEENLNLINTLVVYTGSTLPDDASEYTQFAQNLQAAYSGTLLKDDGNYTHIVNINTSDSVALENLGKTIFNTALGGKEQISTDTSVVSGSCTGLPENAVYYNDANSYSLASASNSISLAASYSSNPTENTCEFQCDTNYTWDNISCNFTPFNLSSLATQIDDTSTSLSLTLSGIYYNDYLNNAGAFFRGGAIQVGKEKTLIDLKGSILYMDNYNNTTSYEGAVSISAKNPGVTVQNAIFKPIGTSWAGIAQSYVDGYGSSGYIHTYKNCIFDLTDLSYTKLFYENKSITNYDNSIIIISDSANTDVYSNGGSNNNYTLLRESDPAAQIILGDINSKLPVNLQY